MYHGQGEFSYELEDDWAQLPAGDSFVDVGGLAIDKKDRLYVLNRGASPIRVFDPEGRLLNSFGAGCFKRPHGAGIAPDGALYATDDGNHIVQKFSHEGDVLLTLGNIGHPSDTGYVSEEGTLSIKRVGAPFNKPTGVAVAENGNIFVSDGYGNACMHKFTSNGELIRSYGGPGTNPGQFRQPHSIRLDALGRLWVCDRENSRIQIFDQDGKFIFEWNDLGGKPSDVFVDATGKGVVYAAIKSGPNPHGISIFDIEGKLICRWGGTEAGDTMFWSPHAIAVDTRGDIYLGEIRHSMHATDQPARALRKFKRKG